MSGMSEILSRFALARHVPPEIRRRALVSKRAALVKTLKAAGAYSPYFGAVAGVATLTRRLGVRLSMAQCAAVMWTALAFLGGGAIAGSLALGNLAVVSALLDERHDDQKTISPDAAHETKKAGSSVSDEKDGKKRKGEASSRDKTDSLETRGKTGYRDGTRDGKADAPDETALEKLTPPGSDDSDSKKDRAAPRGPVIGIGAFETENLDGAQGPLFAARLEQELARIRGSAGVVNVLDGNRNFGARYLLVGSVSGLGGRFTLDARLVDTQDSSVIYAESVQGGSLDELYGACGSLARKISEKVK
ncbi:MAG: hypothetical protein EPN93_18135 [Spirochaetes bacterium]|nr:MAG: hypothetical protein EPN93_18135 [Spirochaetota bacterium]